ncbi:hypothetical protein CYLTODRAFT_396245 [Cylindrobasidium torrendii FP15055 ss-10]|uniref:AFG1-like ATPase n=1 Tax=Cylindrobasidium torrendii FP15055 ss-10 TaxID=1314674 RepID=A0A0D7BCK1_9AGAR|nr:hypothetical protein CYLTODRAFT_396245 [Cylindrobasidium torrendii FP15055 ss-10]
MKLLVKSKDLANEMLDLPSPKGLLITGPPGSGKTFVADTWFASVSTPYKMRKHYNQFVLDLYRDVWDVTESRMHHNLHYVAVDDVDSAASTGTRPKSWTKDFQEQVRGLLRRNDGAGANAVWNRLRKSLLPSSSARNKTTTAALPIPYILASRLIQSAYALLLDEVQLQDVSSALLLSDVLVWYWRMGGVVVGTSNRVPEDLYVNGVQKERLGAFGSALRARCPVIELGSEDIDARDYRRSNAAKEKGEEGQRTWFLGHQEDEFEVLATTLFGEEGGEPSTLSVFGRRLIVPSVSPSGKTCRFSFEQLCDSSLGPADYLTIASTFDTILITRIPAIRLPTAKNQARRFISLIDALYERRCRIVCFAETPLDGLFIEDAATTATDSVWQESVSVSTGAEAYRPNIIAYDDKAASLEEIQPVRRPLEQLSIFSGKDEQFAFKRALSRLVEMTGAGYCRGAEWEPLPEGMRGWERTTRLGRGFGIAQTVEKPQPLVVDAASGGSESMAPTLKADHVWGVREDWGGATARGRSWGRGASVYDKDAKD